MLLPNNLLNALITFSILFFSIILSLKGESINYNINININSSSEINYLYYGNGEDSITNKVSLHNNICSFLYPSKAFGILYLNINGNIFEIHLSRMKLIMNLSFKFDILQLYPTENISLHNSTYDSLLNIHSKYFLENNFEKFIENLKEIFQINPYYVSLVLYKLRFILDDYDDNETLKNIFFNISEKIIDNDLYYFPPKIKAYFKNGFKWLIKSNVYLKKVKTDDLFFLDEVRMDNSYLIFKTDWCQYCKPRIDQILKKIDKNVSLVIIDIGIYSNPTHNSYHIAPNNNSILHFYPNN